MPAADSRKRAAIPAESPLRGVRLAHGLSLNEAARRAGLDPAHLLRVERGERGLSIDSLQRLAQVLDLRDLARLLTPYTTSATAARAKSTAARRPSDGKRSPEKTPKPGRHLRTYPGYDESAQST